MKQTAKSSFTSKDLTNELGQTKLNEKQKQTKETPE